MSCALHGSFGRLVSAALRFAAAAVAAAMLVPALPVASRAAGLPLPAGPCISKLGGVARTLGLSARYTSPKVYAAMCKSAGNEPVRASKTYLSAVMRDAAIQRMSMAPGSDLQTCRIQIGQVAAILGLEARTANAVAFHNACGQAREIAVIATRNLLITYLRKNPAP